MPLLDTTLRVVGLRASLSYYECSASSASAGSDFYGLCMTTCVLQAADAEKDYGEELREREAALEEAMDARAIRGEMLGQDRHYRRYWWYPGKPCALKTLRA